MRYKCHEKHQFAIIFDGRCDVNLCRFIGYVNYAFCVFSPAGIRIKPKGMTYKNVKILERKDFVILFFFSFLFDIQLLFYRWGMYIFLQIV